ncbi:MAG: DsbA family protein [Halioglobus sp.]
MTEAMNAPTVIDYYTDVLCVWAWIAQPRLEELQRQWGGRIQVNHRFMDVFGDSHHKIAQRWGELEGFARFATHVIESSAPFDHAPIHPDIWTVVRPRSSLPAHLVLKAVDIIHGDAVAQAMALRVRRAFFVDGQDISRLDLLLDLASQQHLDSAKINDSILDGRALARLSADQHSARELGARGSPTWVLNEGRQILYGNVGYRILHANIEELLKRPGTEASWC